MTQIDIRKSLRDNAEQGISEEEKRFYQNYDDRIVQVKSGFTAPVPEEQEVPTEFPELNSQSTPIGNLGNVNNLPPIVENKTMPLPVAEQEVSQPKENRPEPSAKVTENISRKEEFIRLREKLLSNKCRTMKSCHFTLSLPIELKDLIEDISVTFHYPRSTVVQWLLIEGLNNEFDLKTEKQINLNQED